MSKGSASFATANTTVLTEDRNADQAFKYLMKHDETSAVSAEDLQRLRRKIDWHIMPLLWLCYVMQFLDKVIYNYAAVMGMPQDLGFRGNDYTNVATAFYVAYIIAEAVNAAALQKMSAAKWLAINVVLWGIACGAAAGTHNYVTMLVDRIFLGIVEAAICPCLVAISSQWYRKDEQSIRFTWWYTGLGIGQIVGGLLSYGFQNLKPGEALLAGWRIMFLTVGGLTLFVGVVTLMFLPASPMSAKWLTESEKVTLLRHISVNRTGVQNFHFHPKQIVETLTDPQVWLLGLLIMAPAVSAGIGTTYSSTLLNLLGFSPQRSALLVTPIGAVTISCTLAVGFGIRYGLVTRATAFCVVSALGIVGACLLAFVPSPTPLHPDQNRENLPTLLAGIYMVNCVTPSLPIGLSWTAANIAGATKKALVYSFVTACFGIGNVIGLQTFQARDIPSGYRPAKVAVVGTLAAGVLFAVVLTAYYYWQNRSRRLAEGAQSEDGRLTDADTDGWKGLSDHEDRAFRYSY